MGLVGGFISFLSPLSSDFYYDLFKLLSASAVSDAKLPD